MSFEGGPRGSRRRGEESGDAEPPPPPPPPPGDPASVPAPPRYLPPLPASPASPERPAAPDEPPAEVAPRRSGAEELPPAGQEVAAAGDSGGGPRRLPDTTVPETAAGKGGPGEPEVGAGGEGEQRGSGEQPETRSVCSSRSSSSGGGDRRSGHQHQHHQPICKICFQGAEQVRPAGPGAAGCGVQQGWAGSRSRRRPFSTTDSARLWVPGLSGRPAAPARSLFLSCEGR